MDKQKKIMILIIILLVASIITFAVYQDGFTDGKEQVEREMFRDIMFKGVYSLYVTDGNQTQVINLVPYIKGVEDENRNSDN